MNKSEFVGPEALAYTTQEIPENEYARRLDDREQQVANIRAVHQRLWMYLIAVGLAGVVVTWAALSSHLISEFRILLPAVVGMSTIQSLAKNARSHGRVQRVVNFYEFGLLRLRHEWQGRGV